MRTITGRLGEEEMKKMTAVMAVVMVLGVALMTATPASAATPQISAQTHAAPAAFIGLLERVMQLLGITSVKTTPSAPGSISPETATWGGGPRCYYPGC
jgi:hypothetical protein